MKWPEWIMLIRHGESTYNNEKEEKKASPVYQRFQRAFNNNAESAETKELAQEVLRAFPGGKSGHATPLTRLGQRQATALGKALSEAYELPDVVYASSYQRAIQTFIHACESWPELKNVPFYKEERIREQDHGEVELYSDWRVYEALFPAQARLYKQQGLYWYRYPQGEAVPDVRDRTRSWTTTIIREFAGKKVMAFTHHLCILAIRANHERLDAEEFIRLDRDEKPINCGLTLYRGDPTKGKQGKLLLEHYNQRLYRI